jgi:hypothetical protein
MKQSLKVAIVAALVIALFGAIAFASYLYTEINRLKTGQPIVQVDNQTATSTQSDIPTSTSNQDTPVKPNLTQKLCESAGGRWNSCGSLCRTEPPGTVCAEVCVLYCECDNDTKYQCPAGFECSDYVPGMQDPLAIGVCKPKEVDPLVSEFKTPDNWTTFVLPNGTALTNPFIFYGTTTAFESVINWRLVDENGAKISEGYANVGSPDMGIPGPFKVKAFFDLVPATKTGRLEVFEASPRDGSDTHKATANVTFPEKTQNITVFFGNSEKVIEGEECESVYPVERMIVIGDAAEISMHELLKGPNALETRSGYYTSLPANIPDPNITYEDDGTHFDFTDALEYQVGGSCRVGHINKQIQETYKEATTNEYVIISINGRTEDILQP